MNTAAIVTFVVIAGFIWGGFVTIASIAMRKEAGKVGAAEDVPIDHR